MKIFTWKKAVLFLSLLAVFLGLYLSKNNKVKKQLLYSNITPEEVILASNWERVLIPNDTNEHYQHALQCIVYGKYDQQFDMQYANDGIAELFALWSRSDMQAALAAAKDIYDFKKQKIALMNCLLTKKGDEGFYKEILAQVRNERKEDFNLEYMKSLTKFDKMKARKLLASADSADLRETLLQGYKIGLRDNGIPFDFLDVILLQKFDDMDKLLNDNPKQCLEFMIENGDPQKYFSKKNLWSIADQLSDANLNFAERFCDLMAEGEGKTNAALCMANKYVRNDLSEAERWIETLKIGKAKDTALAVLIDFYKTHKDQNAVEKWSKLLSTSN